MKNFSALIITLLSASAMANNSITTQNKVWVARLTNQTQCEQRVIHRSNLGAAIADLEQNNGVVVEQAMIARLNDRLFCQSCQCPDGTFYVAQVDVSGSSAEALNGWEVINPKAIRNGRAAVSETAGDAKIQPVVITQ